MHRGTLYEVQYALYVQVRKYSPERALCFAEDAGAAVSSIHSTSDALRWCQRSRKAARGARARSRACAREGPCAHFYVFTFLRFYWVVSPSRHATTRTKLPVSANDEVTAEEQRRIRTPHSLRPLTLNLPTRRYPSDCLGPGAYHARIPQSPESCWD
jgi:hypothetical protein